MKYPFARQRGYRDCGPASVLMLLKYYGGYVSLDKLSEVLCVNNKGTTFYHIVLALRSFGFLSEGYKYEDLSFFKTPCIAHVIKDSFNHYVVIWKVNFKKRYVIIGDPSFGNKKVCINEFLDIWSGNVITATPHGKIINEDEPKVFKIIFKLLRPYVKKIVIASIFSFLSVMCSFVLSFSIQLIIMHINSNLLLGIFTFFICVIFLNLFVSYFRNVILLKISHGLDKSLSLDTFSHIIKLPHAARFRKTTGEIISYFNDLLLIKDVISKFLISIFIDFPIIIFVFGYFFFFDLVFAFSIVLILVLYLVVHFFYKSRLYYLSDEVLRNKAMVNSYITEHISGIETVNNLNIEDKIIDDFKEKYYNYYRAVNRCDRVKIFFSIFNNSVFYLFDLLVLIYGVFSVKNGLSISHFMTIYLLTTLMNNSFMSLFDFSVQFKDVLSSVHHIYDLYDSTSFPLIHVNGNIEIKHLKYSFDKVNDVLKDVNLFIKMGSKVLVTGKSGSGKSTLFKILKGYFRDYSGSVKINSFNVSLYEFKNIIYVSAFETLFSGRVYDNLSLRRFDNLNNKICEIDDFIYDYDYILDENGINMSSGQRQRISLSRALSDFDILIIDEGLADVDENMERRILKKMFLLYGDKTIIFISHRISNLDLFDRYIKMDNGRVVLDEVRN